jgi:hypothetical protein
VPLFLGGTETGENLEVIDLGVSRTLCGHFAQASVACPGSRINEIVVRDAGG